MLRFPPLTPLVKKLLLGLCGVFVVTLLLEKVAGIPAFDLLALSPDVGIWSTWQVLTHVLVYPADPGSILSLGIGLVFLWWMAAPFEQRFGAGATFQILLAGTIAAGIATLAASQVLPASISFGISPFYMAIVAGYALSLPKDARLSFFGVLPMRPMGLVVLFLGLSALSHVAADAWAGIAGDVAAVGAGFLHTKWTMRPRRAPPRGAKGGPKRSGRRFEVIEGGRADDERPPYLN